MPCARPPDESSCVAAPAARVQPESKVADKFRVGLTRDILDARGAPAFGPAALGILDQSSNLDWDYLPRVVHEIDADMAAHYDALYVNIAKVPAAAVARPDCRLRVVARHGVGYDSVDVAAMTRAGVLVTNTPSSMPRPVATTALTFVLALAGKLFLKDRLTRSGRWNERMDNMGIGLTGRTLGVIGAGRIGQELLRMARTFDLKLIVADPLVNDIQLAYLGARKVELPVLMREADFVVVCCLLNEKTHHLIGAKEFAQMRPEALFINVARGGIVDEPALIQALRERRIAGAALDVFEQEPVDPANALLSMDNVIVTPHSLCWTDECFHNMASTGLKSIVDALNGRRPEFIVNHEVLSHPRVKAWLVNQ
jgi:phosphoglycerate dehydrogenase-like enzyme